MCSLFCLDFEIIWSIKEKVWDGPQQSEKGALTELRAGRQKYCSTGDKEQRSIWQVSQGFGEQLGKAELPALLEISVSSTVKVEQSGTS